MLKYLWTSMMAALLCGCFDVKDELIVEADGSGKIRIESSTSAEAVSGVSAAIGMFDGSVAYPPTDQEQAEHFFPRNDFKVTVTTREEGGKQISVVEASFTNINAVLNSPYGRAHQLIMEREGSSLVLKALTGMEGAARIAETKQKNGISEFLPSSENLEQEKTNMRVQFRVTLPAPVSSGNGTASGRSMDWVVERKAFTNGVDFANRVGAILEARWPGDAIHFTPVSPTRLGLLPFSELSAGSADAGSAIDTNRITGSARFVPLVLTVERAVDLSGEHTSAESGSTLLGEIVLPPDLKPQKVGTPVIAEAVDARGNDLKLAESDENSWRRSSRVYFGSGHLGDDDEGGEGDPNRSHGEFRHPVALSFKAPDWRIPSIARVRGSVELQYFSGATRVKLTNAIPAVVDPSQRSGGSTPVINNRSIGSPELERLGISLELSMAMVQDGLLVLVLDVEARGAALLDVQVFDSTGRPFPTLIPEKSAAAAIGGEDSDIYVLVAGAPAPPLSLAILASGSGTAVNVPIQLENIPLHRK